MIVELTKGFSDEQIRLYESMTKLRRDVALASLAGMKPAEAHRAARPKPLANESQRANLGHQILKIPQVADFLNTFKVAPSTEMASAVASRDEILRDLTEISNVLISDVMSFTARPLIDMENGNVELSSSIYVKSMDEIPPGAMKAIKTVKQTKYGIELTLYDAVAVRKQIAEMCGYDAPKKTELSGPNGQPIQIQEIPDEEMEEKLRSLGLGRYHNQLGGKRVE